MNGLAARARSIETAARAGNLERVLVATRGTRIVDPPGSTLSPDDAALAGGLGRAQAPTANLYRAVRDALAMLGPMPAHDLHRALRMMGSSLPRLDPTDGPVMQAGDVARLPRSVRQSIARTGPASALLARALDRSLPELRSAAEAPNGRSLSGCDLVDRLPYLCVGSAANNTYEDDAALLIDLGGDDTYLNSSGGAPFLAPDEDVMLTVSVNVDLGGNDRYSASRPMSPVDDLWVVAQGSGFIGSVGILVDDAGDDVYTATPNESPTVLAQGTGNLGTGILADRGGSDRYTIDGSGFPEERAYRGQLFLVGQASTWPYGTCLAGVRLDPPVLVAPPSCSTAIFLDTGRGNDDYLIDGGRWTDDAAPALRLMGQGAALLDPAALYDDGGRDSFVTRGAAVGGAPVQSVWIETQGSGRLGAGMLIEGDGPTTYDARTEGTGATVSLLAAQGASVVGGSGFLADAGGGDLYSAVMSRRGDAVVTLRGCSVADAACPHDTVVDLSGAPAFVYAQGSAGDGGVASVLLDGGGDDRYEAVADESVHVMVDQDDPASFGRPRVSAIGYKLTTFTAQGGSAGVSGLGVLADEGGDDAYSARARRETTVTSSSAEPLLRAFSTKALAAAQGAARIGLGALLDRGRGTNSFEAISSNESRTAPDPAGARQSGAWWGVFHGDAGGMFVAPESSSVVAHPSRPTCLFAEPSSRGHGRWSGCSSPVFGRVGADPDHQDVDGGTGVSNISNLVGHGQAGSPAMEIPMLSLAAAGAAPIGSMLGVEARLTTSTGDPIPAATVTVDLQRRPSMDDVDGLSRGDIVEGWRNAWEINLRTGEDGVATGMLPTALVSCAGSAGHCVHPRIYEFQVFATYDGVPDLDGTGIAPRHAASAVALTGDLCKDVWCT